MMDNKQFTTRQLSAPDVALVGDMLTMFGEAFGDSSAYGSARPDRNYLAQLLRRDHFIAIAAPKNGSVVGGSSPMSSTRRSTAARIPGSGFRRPTIWRRR
jgi:aminoglycoside 3-N-acetyltransferase I